MPSKQRFTVIPRRFNACIYAAELSNGFVKVGFSRNPRTRMESLNGQVKRRFGTAVVRWHISRDFTNVRQGFQVESLLIRRMNAIGARVPGTTEFFHGVSFDVAAGLIEQIAPLCDNTADARNSVAKA